MKTEILKMLRHTEQYVSGQEICDLFGVSRTAVWKVINQLKEEGYEIEAVPNKGYHILACPDVVSKEELESCIETDLIGKKVAYFEETDSTNTQAKRLAEDADTDGLLVVTERQTAGKGRRGKTWESPKGSGIWMSMVLKPDMNPTNASGLTLVAALSVVRAIRELLDLDAWIKWPNDIVINGKKVCGILTEMSSELDYINHVVIGIGINANMEVFPEEISSIATSLYLEGGKTINRSQLISKVLSCFEAYYGIYQKTQDLSSLITEYDDLLINRNKEVMVMEGSTQYCGIALGINHTGKLLVQIGETVKHIVAGEVSVRGIYGYV